MLNLRKVAPFTSFSAQVYQTLKDAIIWCELKPGGLLLEKALAEQMGVSRTPIREALQRLQQEGLVEVVPHKGAFIAPLRARDIIEAMTVREALEITAVKICIERIGEREIAEMKEFLDTQRKAVAEKDFRRFIEADEKFHEVVLKASENQRLYQVVAQMQAHIRRARVLSLSLPGKIGEYIDDHAAILEALKRKDFQEVTAKLSCHLRRMPAILSELSGIAEETVTLPK